MSAHPYCQEYLGKTLGYCLGAVQTWDVNGRGFCVEHAKERGF
jgi:hypothetical protein